MALESPGKELCAILTNLPHRDYSAERAASSLYRLSWEIEKDNRSAATAVGS